MSYPVTEHRGMPLPLLPPEWEMLHRAVGIDPENIKCGGF